MLLSKKQLIRMTKKEIVDYIHTEVRMHQQASATLGYLLDRINSSFKNKLKELDDVQAFKDKGYWNFIASVMFGAYAKLSFAIKHHKLGKRWCSPMPQFLDVGCGIGNILALAKEIGYEVYGIEFEHNTYEYAVRLAKEGFFRFDHDSIYKLNALEFECYHDFDVIYYYRPIEDEKMESELERKIEDDMKVGAILIPQDKIDNKIKKDKRFKIIGGKNIYGVYQKVEQGGVKL